MIKKEFPDAWDGAIDVEDPDDKDKEDPDDKDNELGDPLGKDSGDGPDDGPGGGFAAPEEAPAMMVA